MNRAATATLSLGALFALSGCFGGTQESTEGVFDPPPSFTKQPNLNISINPILGMWTGKGNGDFIVLLRLPATAAGKATDLASSSAGTTGTAVDSRKQIRLCRGIVGTEISMHGRRTEAGSTSDVAMNVVVAPTTDKTLMAMYGHDIKDPADPQALASLEKLCPKQNSHG